MMEQFEGAGGCWHGRDPATRRPIAVSIAGGVITEITGLAQDDPDLPWISAGWLDLQVNGCNGGDFNGPDVSESSILAMSRYLWSRGVAAYLPTIVTGSFAGMKRAMEMIDAACRQDRQLAAAIPGIHMEGPYISSEDGPRGAHAARFARDPDPDEFARLLKSAGRRIRLVTLAPERRGALDFIRTLSSGGVVVSIGHSAASRQNILDAAAAGATMSTHLGNGAHTMIHRHHNYIWEQLAEDRLTAGLIADGHHLPEAVLKTMLRAKGEKAFVVSDCVSLAGLPPGVYGDPAGQQVVLHANGRLNLKENPQLLAGSASTLDQGLAFLVGPLALPLDSAIGLITRKPADAMGWSDYGRLVPGAAGNLTLFRIGQPPAEVSICETVVRGIPVFRGEAPGKTGGAK